MKTFKIFLEEYSGIPKSYGTENDPRLDVSKPYKMAQDDPELAKIIRTGADDPSTEGDDGLSDKEWRQKRAEETKLRMQTALNPRLVNIGRKGESEEFVEVPKDAPGNSDAELLSNTLRSQQKVADIFGWKRQTVAELEKSAIDKLTAGLHSDPKIKELLSQVAAEKEARRSRRETGKRNLTKIRR
jgi:hypothetical protein